MKPQLNKTFGILLDLAIYITVMFAIRELYFEQFSFIVNGLMWSFTCLAIAMWRMHARGVTWKDLGLGFQKPRNYKKTALVTAGILAATVATITIFNMLKDSFNWFPVAEVAEIIEASTEPTVSKFGDLKGNWLLFFSIMPMVLIESTLEELLDRGFLLNWFEKLFSNTWFATVIAVLLQAAIFGFRHSHDLSSRSITTGLIGLVMGIAYVAFGRKLWPLILAHCILNTMSMMDRV